MSNQSYTFLIKATGLGSLIEFPSNEQVKAFLRLRLKDIASVEDVSRVLFSRDFRIEVMPYSTISTEALTGAIISALESYPGIINKVTGWHEQGLGSFPYTTAATAKNWIGSQLEPAKYLLNKPLSENPHSWIWIALIAGGGFAVLGALNKIK